MQTSFIDRLKAWLQYPLPHHALSRLIFWLTRLETRHAQPVMRWFARHYGVNMHEAVTDNFSAYPSFNAFFTRALKENARAITRDQRGIACPVDGTVSQAGSIHGGRIFQAKGRTYSLVELLGGNPAHAKPFVAGKFATLYLAPRDYHRIHMPLDARLKSMTHVPGRLFSVAPHTVSNVPNLFARNERVVALFDSNAGELALILVGAMNVAAIETVWAGLVTPPQNKAIAGKTIRSVDYHGDAAMQFAKGDEMGRFNMGSTVILLMQGGVTVSNKLTAGSTVKMGEAIGTFTLPVTLK